MTGLRGHDAGIVGHDHRNTQAGPQHWRIRVGTAGRDTSHAIAVILATRLQNTGKQVDLFMPWDVPHSGDYDLDELFGWIDRTVAAGQGGR